MVNGVLLIVAAVLFAVLYLLEGLGIMWLWIAGFYFVAGVLDLIFHVVKEKAKVRSANKKAEKTAQEAAASRKEAEEAKKKLEEPKQEENV
jgi:predicted membrane protein